MVSVLVEVNLRVLWVSFKMIFCKSTEVQKLSQDAPHTSIFQVSFAGHQAFLIFQNSHQQFVHSSATWTWLSWDGWSPTGLLLWLNGFERSTVAGHGRRIHSYQAADATSTLLDRASQANVQHTQARYIPFGSNLLMAEVRAQGRAWRWCRRSWHTVWKWQVRLHVCDKSQTNTANKPRLQSWQMAKFDIPC